jgi:hypothetical protein
MLLAHNPTVPCRFAFVRQPHFFSFSLSFTHRRGPSYMMHTCYTCYHWPTWPRNTLITATNYISATTLAINLVTLPDNFLFHSMLHDRAFKAPRYLCFPNRYNVPKLA